METSNNNQLFAKQSKYFFYMQQIEHLWHIISKEGVTTYQKNTKAMKKWPIPFSIK
jgi:hypothetical protein